MDIKILLLILAIILAFIIIILSMSCFKCKPIKISTCGIVPTDGYSQTATGSCLMDCDKRSDACYLACDPNDDHCVRSCYAQKATCYMTCLGNGKENLIVNNNECGC